MQEQTTQKTILRTGELSTSQLKLEVPSHPNVQQYLEDNQTYEPRLNEGYLLYILSLFKTDDYLSADCFSLTHTLAIKADLYLSFWKLKGVLEQKKDENDKYRLTQDYRFKEWKYYLIDGVTAQNIEAHNGDCDNF